MLALQTLNRMCGYSLGSMVLKAKAKLAMVPLPLFCGSLQ